MVCTQLTTSLIGINWYWYELPVVGSFHGCPKNVNLLAFTDTHCSWPEKGMGLPPFAF